MTVRWRSHSFLQRIHRNGYNQAGDKDTRQPGQDSDHTPPNRYRGNITVADGQPGYQGEVQGICKRHFFKIGDRCSIHRKPDDQPIADTLYFSKRLKETAGET